MKLKKVEGYFSLPLIHLIMSHFDTKIKSGKNMPILLQML